MENGASRNLKLQGRSLASNFATDRSPVITASNDYDVALQYIALLDAPARSHWKIGDAPKNRCP